MVSARLRSLHAFAFDGSRNAEVGQINANVNIRSYSHGSHAVSREKKLPRLTSLSMLRETTFLTFRSISRR